MSEVYYLCCYFAGIGWGMFIVSSIAGIYYNMIIAWAFYYMFASFASDVPWKTCDNPWNTPGLYTLYALSIPMLRILLSKAQGRKDF